MGFFNSVVEQIQEKFQESAERKRQEKEMMHRLRKEAEAQRILAFEDAFRENAKRVAISQAKKDAARLSGIQKLRASERVRRLQDIDRDNPNVFQKLSIFTQKNLARRESNLKRTEERRKLAEGMKRERLEKLQKERENRISRKNGY